MREGGKGRGPVEKKEEKFKEGSILHSLLLCTSTLRLGGVWKSDAY